MNFIPVTPIARRSRHPGFDPELPTAPGIEKGTLGIRPVHYGTVGGDAITIRVDPNLEGRVGGPDAPQG